MIEAGDLRLPSTRTLFYLALGLVAGLFPLDLITGAAVILVPGYAFAPLLAALRCRVDEVAIVAGVAIAAGLLATFLLEVTSEPQTIVRLLCVVGVSGLAVWVASVRSSADEAATREAFLGRTGALLSESAGDAEETLARVVDAAVPAVADWCAIDLRGAGDELRRVGVAHVDPAKRRLAGDLQRRWPARIDDPNGAGLVIRTGEPQWIADIPPVADWPENTRDPEHLRVLGELGLRSSMIVPLQARGRTFGAITLVSAESGRRYGPHDLAFALELGRRCALAIDNGTLLAEARDAERRLTESFGLVDALFASAPIGLALFDRDLRFARVNDHLAGIHGLPAGEHAGKRIEEVVPGIDPRAPAALERVLATGAPVVEDEISRATPRPNGIRREFDCVFYPVRRGEEVVGVGVVMVEITDRRLAERALRGQTDRYETLLLALSEVGEGMVVLEDEALVDANPAFEQLTGYGLDELRAMESIWDLIPASKRHDARRRASLRVERGAVDPHYELVVTHRSGRLVDLEVAGVPLRIDERDQLVVVVRDITARKRAEAEREQALAMERQARELAEAAERRMSLLAGASALFDETLDEGETLERVARLTVAEVADTCVVYLTDSTLGARQAIAVARDPRREALMEELSGRWPSELDPERTMARVLRTGGPELLRGMADHLEQYSQDAGHRAQVRALALTAVALVPLRARGRTFGVLACGFLATPPPDHEQEVLSLLDDLARRAALAMDNARLYAERSHVARTLQQSLLPPALPELRGAVLAARYEPAGEGTEVGGDFYDCFATARDEYALVIGDVCGKGAEAAAITALARYTMRASVLHSESPVQVLSELNEALLRQELHRRFCTVLYCALARGDGGWRVRLAAGGHPLPYHVTGCGRVAPAGRAGTLLGVVGDPDLEESELLLAPGDSLVLYTDGVTEASPIDGAFGPDALERLLSEHAGRPAGEIAAAVETAVRAAGPERLRDDVAVVVLQVASGT